jgi:hypothetical protein
MAFVRNVASSDADADVWPAPVDGVDLVECVEEVLVGPLGSGDVVEEWRPLLDRVGDVLFVSELLGGVVVLVGEIWNLSGEGFE